MATTRDIVERALRRIRLVAYGESVDADLAAAALAALNDMLASWKRQGILITNAPFALGDTFAFFVPPAACDAETIALLDYKGNWNADTDTPALASALATQGSIYKVSVSGDTVLDELTSWNVGDYVVATATEYLKGDTSAGFHSGITDLLAMELAPEYGRTPDDIIALRARDGLQSLFAAFVKPGKARFDNGLTMMPSRRWGVVEIIDPSGVDFDGGTP